MADALYVVTWFRRGAAQANGPAASRWDHGLRAFVDPADAHVELQAQIRAAQACAGSGDRSRVPLDLGCSHAELTSYTLARAPDLELVAQVITSPPRGDLCHRLDPLAGSGTWWITATVIVAWWGGSEKRDRSSAKALRGVAAPATKGGARASKPRPTRPARSPPK